MTIKFLKLRLHHFLSFDDSTIDLMDKGYCLVRGVNRNPKDFAKSNGAGKSTIFNAISYALTGETLQGLKSNLANIYFDDGCWVELTFEVNGKEYILMRSKDDKTLGTNLKITIDGEDKSGKGIRESQALLDQYLPELTSELIGSTILIGQGMPMKFTSNSPSGRKEVLEHLSQSDFMIQDIKERINKRITELSTRTREVEDSLLRLETLDETYQVQLKSHQEEFINKFTQPIDFKSLIENLNQEKEHINADIRNCNESLKTISTKQEESNNKLFDVTKQKEDLVNKYFNEHQQATKEFNESKTQLTNKIYALSQEITRLKNIKDVCPTCGQKIPGAIKQDTAKQEEELNELQQKLKNLNDEIELDNKDYQDVLLKINNKFDDSIKQLQQANLDNSQEVRAINSRASTLQNKLEEISSKLGEVANSEKFYNENKSKLLDTIQTLKDKLEELSKNEEIETKAKELLSEHNEVISKMNTIVKRDFRGFLLKNIIDYINTKAKEYSSQIFGCDEINFELDGNDINIAFCGKDYENLSGGEKQRVDLIVQFAIRSFMCQFLNFSSNILVLDEIFDALDSESCDRVINFITNELKDIESVFIISHHDSELSIPYDSQLIVEKNDLGVSHVIF